MGDYGCNVVVEWCQKWGIDDERKQGFNIRLHQEGGVISSLCVKIAFCQVLVEHVVTEE